ncbi:histidine kinase-like protein [Kineococcus xinjiangensis]|uniref:Histidine kinase-like protein n=1 Tax=Kineococcus xinjiangensis TaxID=512762 RepID=A0A2S6IV46_9ACTN|nr:ATP-binding protein [Kineococcus xinjiangensis]PPK98106.1 histidine kinase-like protein [Kineococcus xinjiangensis]
MAPSVVTLAPEPTSSRAARRFVADFCEREGIVGEPVDTLLLLTAEVVTNAVVYGRSDVVLTLTSTARRVRVSVGDENTRLPQRRDPDPDALNGRGLVLVEALAERHGIDVSPEGKTVWFDVDTLALPTAALQAPAHRPRYHTPSGCGTRQLTA